MRVGSDVPIADGCDTKNYNPHRIRDIKELVVTVLNPQSALKYLHSKPKNNGTQ